MFATHLDLSSQTAWLLAVVLFFLVCIKYILSRRARRLPLPPGPPGLPMLGNVSEIARSHAWIVYRDYAAKYGDVVSLTALGQSFVILNSHSASLDLLEKRSSIYSDRPANIMTQLTGWDWTLALKRYGEDWRRVRRPFWQHFHSNAVKQYEPAQQLEARHFIRRLLSVPEDLDTELKSLLAKTICAVVHGVQMEDEQALCYSRVLTEAEVGFSEVFRPGSFFVEFLPWLRHVPAWFPFTGWQKKVQLWRGQSDVMLDDPFNLARDAMQRGVALPSMISRLLEHSSDLKGEKGREEERIIKETTSVAYGAAIDTTSVTILSFFCAMLLHPSVQARAQAELDRVIGPDRLPEHADRASLPYVRALVKESLRWHNVGPLGIAHRCMQEDVYRGWRIPEGAIVLPNIWAMLHDPEVYPEPDAFRPERFLALDGELNPDVPDPSSMAFGYGRRICPGRHFAEDVLFITLASILHVFDIVPALDAHGLPIPVELKPTSGFISHVEHFAYSVRPRSKAAEALIQGVA
ncbi:cytochrome P450 [Cubamyces sp. BRFM 1775]|nr:cytochrome P450 [Cubamyces sp. BRFM 1775]